MQILLPISIYNQNNQNKNAVTRQVTAFFFEQNTIIHGYITKLPFTTRISMKYNF
jgi:hypothetical protein